MLTAHDATGRKNIWLAAQHSLDFPAVVEKLSAQGEPEAESWNNGHVTLLTDRWLGDRHLVFVGGTNNEHWGAALAVLDYEMPAGSAPATNPEYRTFDKTWSLIRVEAGDQYRATHAALVLGGRLKDPFGPAAEAQLLPVLRWKGQSFVAIRPATRRP